MNKTIGIAGYGNMGRAIYKSISHKTNTIIYDPFAMQIKDLPFESILDKFLSNIDVLILCMKPNQIVPFLKSIDKPREIISIAAGISYSTIKSNSPIDTKIVRMMPNLPMQIGEGAIGVFGDGELVDYISKLFNDLGKIFIIEDENLMDSITALSGSGPAFVYAFLNALAEGGLKTGLSYEKSLEIAIQTIKGSILLMENEYSMKNTHPSVLRNRVTSAGGTTIYGLHSLEKAGFHGTVMDAIEDAYRRSKELKKD
jgi:pyrroline-5-carboxylate reductase